MFRPKRWGPEIYTDVVHSSDEWVGLCQRHRDDARALLKARRPDGTWMSCGFAVECCLKAAIMKKEGFNRWPDRDSAPDLWTHELRDLLRRLGIDPQKFDTKWTVAPSLKMVLDWRREHGYAVGKLPQKYAQSMYDAAFDADGVVEWIADLYRLNI